MLSISALKSQRSNRKNAPAKKKKSLDGDNRLNETLDFGCRVSICRKEVNLPEGEGKPDVPENRKSEVIVVLTSDTFYKAVSILDYTKLALRFYSVLAVLCPSCADVLEKLCERDNFMCPSRCRRHDSKSISIVSRRKFSLFSSSSIFDRLLFVWFSSVLTKACSSSNMGSLQI